MLVQKKLVVILIFAEQLPATSDTTGCCNDKTRFDSFKCLICLFNFNAVFLFVILASCLNNSFLM